MSQVQDLLDVNKNNVSVKEQGGCQSQSELRCLETQVGGHRSGHSKNEKPGKKNLGMYDLGNGQVLKALCPPPRGTRELAFYQQVFSQECADPDLIDLRPFLPKFHGFEERENTKFLKLTNLTSVFQKPCIIDLKIGRITYNREATAEKIREEEKKFPPVKTIGFQISGMMIQNHHEKKVLDKAYCKSLTEDNFLSDGLGVFFSVLKDDEKEFVLRGLISRLRKLEAWFLRQRKFSFTASSLLVIYEGQHGNELSCSGNRSTANIREHQNQDRGPESESPLNSAETFSTQKIEDQSLLKPSLKRLCATLADTSDNCLDQCCKSKKLKEKVSRLSEDNSESHDECLNTNDSFLSTSRNGIYHNSLFSVHLIDFAHVFPVSNIDENFLFGLQNLISYLHKLLPV